MKRMESLVKEVWYEEYGAIATSEVSNPFESAKSRLAKVEYMVLILCTIKCASALDEIYWREIWMNG